VSEEVNFAPDLYQGTAGYYDRCRLSHPAALTGDLLRRTRASGTSGRGRLLDLACGTGQLAFALRDRFAEAWAVDVAAGWGGGPAKVATGSVGLRRDRGGGEGLGGARGA
jgi:hypothetical protein